MNSEEKQTEPFGRKIITSLLRVDRLHRQIAENAVSGKIKIHRSQHHCLMYIAHSRSLTSQKDIADHFQVSPAYVAVTLKKLENDGYITRASTEGDSRKNEINITDSGREIVDRSRALFDQIDNAVLEGIDRSELEAMKSTLDKIYENLIRMQSEKTNRN